MKYEELNLAQITEQAKLPKVIKFTDDGEEIPISHPAIQDVIKAAASIERRKLYSSMQSLQEQNEELSQKVVATPATPSVQQVTSATVEASQNPETRLLNQNKAIKTTMENEKNKGGVSREEVHEILNEAFTKTLPEILRSQLAPVTETISNIQKQTIEEYRNARIAELGDTIIPELVEGNTKDEIEVSIIKSRTLRAKYNAPAPAPAATEQPPIQTSTQQLAPQTVQVPAVTVQAPVTPAPTVPPATPNASDKNLPDFTKMSADEFGKNRESLAKSLREQYGGAQ